MTQHDIGTDPKLDLVLDRVVDVPPELVWAAWTEPRHMKHWFAPAPLTLATCEVDLRPGGIYRADLRLPDGEESNMTACILEVVPGRRLVWTLALLPGFRPAAANPEPVGFAFTAVIQIEPEGGGTRYTALSMYADEPIRKKHDEMGWHKGWGTALDQLVAYAKSSMWETLQT